MTTKAADIILLGDVVTLDGGGTRAEAIARMRHALEGFIIEGVTTTIPFLLRVMTHPDFVAGELDTKFLERERQLLRDGP